MPNTRQTQKITVQNWCVLPLAIRHQCPVSQQKMRPTNSMIYETLRYTLKAIRCCASYIVLNSLGLGMNSEFLCH